MEGLGSDVSRHQAQRHPAVFSRWGKTSSSKQSKRTDKWTLAPVFLGDNPEAPRYEQVSGKEASRELYIAYQDICSYLEDCNQISVLRREQLIPKHLLPRCIQLVFARQYAAGEGLALDNEQLLRAVESQCSFVVNGDELPRRIVDQVARSASMHAAE